MTISRIEIYKCLIVAGIGYGSILFMNSTYSKFIRRFQLLDGSLESADHAEGEDTDVDSAHAQLLVEGSVNSVDQTEGEDAFNDSTHTQVSGVQSTIAKGVLQNKVKRLDNKNHTTRIRNGFACGRDLMSEIEENTQDKKNDSTRTCSGYARGRDLMSEIKEHMQKTENRIRAPGGRITNDVWDS